ncbi:uncharacterized protein LOC112268590 [Brachypodium distachyon]|uniref:Uncharacterized protein n=1 Tax=Brachypodium distachyon TaxID=15368 RepID=A0A2K2DLH1_BRADI|nr:uncharacterized protein LOC112268590 [Brachypodium distachyon]PNT75132.1 hypothetical protein BRADI_1g28003v3 [Brachypodium distachyon]|eukprot:XP_024310170.1 uncharacterized protein LOC112268590 [Brachypodium distachyon]
MVYTRKHKIPRMLVGIVNPAAIPSNIELSVDGSMHYVNFELEDTRLAEDDDDLLDASNPNKDKDSRPNDMDVDGAANGSKSATDVPPSGGSKGGGSGLQGGGPLPNSVRAQVAIPLQPSTTSFSSLVTPQPSAAVCDAVAEVSAASAAVEASTYERVAEVFPAAAALLQAASTCVVDATAAQPLPAAMAAPRLAVASSSTPTVGLPPFGADVVPPISAGPSQVLGTPPLCGKKLASPVAHGLHSAGTGVFAPIVYRRRGVAGQRKEVQALHPSPSLVSRESQLQLLMGCGYSLEAATKAVGRMEELASPPAELPPFTPMPEPRRSACLSVWEDLDDDSMAHAKKLAQSRNLEAPPGVSLMYKLAAIMGVVTEGATQGTDGIWRQATRVDHQRVYIPVWVAC